MTPTLPLSLVMAVVFILGLLMGAGLIVLKLMALQWKTSKSEKLTRQQANEIIELKKQIATLKQSDSAAIVQQNQIAKLEIK